MKWRKINIVTQLNALFIRALFELEKTAPFYHRRGWLGGRKSGRKEDRYTSVSTGCTRGKAYPGSSMRTKMTTYFTPQYIFMYVYNIRTSFLGVGYWEMQRKLFGFLNWLFTRTWSKILSKIAAEKLTVAKLVSQA